MLALPRWRSRARQVPLPVVVGSGAPDTARRRRGGRGLEVAGFGRGRVVLAVPVGDVEPLQGGLHTQLVLT